MTSSQRSRAAADQRLRDTILQVVGDDIVVVGTVPSLAQGLGTTARRLRSCLRELLETEQISVESDGKGQFAIRRERRTASSVLPIVERRRPRPDRGIADLS